MLSQIDNLSDADIMSALKTKSPSYLSDDEIMSALKSKVSASNQANIARSKVDVKANYVSPEPHTSDYMTGLGQSFKEAGQDVARGASRVGANIGPDLNELMEGPGSQVSAARDAQLAAEKKHWDSIPGGIDWNAAKPSVAIPAMANTIKQSVLGLNKGIQQGVVGPIQRANSDKGPFTEIGPNSIPEQVIEAFAQKPASTTAAIVGGFQALDTIVSLIPKVTRSVASETAASQATGKAPARISAPPKAVPGDFVQSATNKQVYGRVIGGANGKYTVKGPNGTYTIEYSDIGRHATAQVVDARVGANPGSEQIFGTADGSGGYHFGGKGVPVPDEPVAPGKPTIPNQQVGPPTTETPQIADTRLTTSGDNPGQYAPSPIRPTPTGPTSQSAPTTPYYGITPQVIKMLTSGPLMTTEQYPGRYPGTLEPSGAPPTYLGPTSGTARSEVTNALVPVYRTMPPDIPAPAQYPWQPRTTNIQSLSDTEVMAAIKDKAANQDRAGAEPNAPKFRPTERGYVRLPSPDDLTQAKNEFRDKFMENLNALRQHAPESYNAALELAGAPATTGTIMHGAMQEAATAMRKHGGLPTLIDTYYSSNLRDISDHWVGLAAQAWNPTKPVIVTPNFGGPTVLHPDVIHDLENLEHPAPHPSAGIVKKAESLAAKAGKTGDDTPVRDFLNTTYTRAANTAMTNATILQPTNKFNKILASPEFKIADQHYAQVEKILRASHQSNDGVLSTRLGPAGRYIPKTATDANGQVLHGHAPGIAQPELSKPSNKQNHFATGQAPSYDTSVEQFRNNVSGALHRNGQAALVNQLHADRVLQPESDGTVVNNANGVPIGITMKLPDGSTHDATLVNTDMQGNRSLVPIQIMHELAPMLHKPYGWGGEDVNYGKLAGFANFVNMCGFSNISVPIVHTENLLSNVAHEIAMHGGLPAKIVNALPLVGRLRATIAAHNVDPFTPKSMKLTAIAAKMGGVPSSYGSHTWNAREAEDTGATLSRPEIKTTTIKGVPIKYPQIFSKNTNNSYTFHPVDLSPLMFGRAGLDIRMRILTMDMILKKLGLNEDQVLTPDGRWIDPKFPGKAERTLAKLGRYVAPLESDVVRKLKASGLGPAASAHSTMGKNAVSFWMNPRTYTVGALLATVSWHIAHKMQTGKWPEETDTPFGYLPLVYKGQTSYWSYMGAINTLYARGARITGIAPAYDAMVQGMPPVKVADKWATGPINAGLGFMGPSAETGFRAVTGVEPYLGGMMDNRGKIGLQTYTPDYGDEGPQYARSIPELLQQRANAVGKPFLPAMTFMQQNFGVGSEATPTEDTPKEMKALMAISKVLAIPIKKH